MVSRNVRHGGIDQRTITPQGHRAYARAADQARPELDRWPSNINGPHLPYYYELADGPDVRRKMWCGAMAPGGSRAYGRGNQASFCTDGRALDEFEVQARFERASDIPPRVFELWRSRAG